MASTEESAATAISNTTDKCLCFFDRITAKHDECILNYPFATEDKRSSRDFLGLRNGFLFWVEQTGAISPTESSLDTRLLGLTHIRSSVVELLDMILRNLQRRESYISSASNPAKPQEAIMRWESSAIAIDSALKRLDLLAAEIKKSSDEQLECNFAMFLPVDDFRFHRDVVSLVRKRFPASRKELCQQLGDSIAVRRRLFLQKQYHSKATSMRVPNRTPFTQQGENLDAESSTVTDFSPENRIVRQLHVPAGSITMASRPDPSTPALRQVNLPKRPAQTALNSTISTSREDLFEYPQRPRAKPGESQIQCPYCLMPLDNVELQNGGDEYWRHHIDKDLKPYSCLFPQCAKAVSYFTRREEWKSHMVLTHSRDWPRKVHALVWCCDIDHDSEQQFETEVEWRKHMKDPSSHPKRPTANKYQLEAMSLKKKKVALRDHFVCPLCEQVPNKIHLVVEEAEDRMVDLQESLFDHIADHIKSLSLLSLPGLDIAATPPEEKEQSHHLGEASLPSVAYSIRDSEKF
ncbi:hypothetical protein F5Y10DRAFT_276594 [Nemania abortiva]|nr:hypothetical protein F5Y10DRAFT_276594 [Nemania abortiva]